MMNVEEFFAGGRARAPWTLSIADAGGSRQVESGPLASSYGLLQTHSVDVQAQEDGKAFVWSGPATFGLSGPVADMTLVGNATSFAFAGWGYIIARRLPSRTADRKSTRLNSSH